MEGVEGVYTAWSCTPTRGLHVYMGWGARACRGMQGNAGGDGGSMTHLAYISNAFPAPVAANYQNALIQSPEIF